MPDFWLGLMLLYFFAVELKIAPVVSGSSMKNIFLPAFTLSVANTAVYTRVLRGNLLEASSGDYILAARARGLGEKRCVGKAWPEKFYAPNGDTDRSELRKNVERPSGC